MLIQYQKVLQKVLQIGKLLEKKGQFKEALNFLDQKIQENLQDIRFYEEKGNSTLDVAATLMRNREQEEIIKCWDFGIEQNQSNIEFYKAKINALKKLGRNNEVIECINKWMRLNKNCSLVEFELSQISSYKFDCNNLSLIDQQLQIILINQLMIVMIWIGQQEKNFYVQIILETLLPIVNQDEIQLANILKQLGKDKEILQCLDFGIMNNINNIDFYYAKSMYLESQGKDQEAVDCWKFGIEKNKNSLKFYDSYSILLTKLNRIQEIVDCMQFGIEQNPDQIRFYEKKVTALIELKEEQKVIDCLDYGISQHKTDLQFYKYKCDKEFLYNQVKYQNTQEEMKSVLNALNLVSKIILLIWNFIMQKAIQSCNDFQLVNQIIWIVQMKNLNVGHVELKSKKIALIVINKNLICYADYKDMRKLSNYWIMEFKITIRMRVFTSKKVKPLITSIAYALKILGRNEEVLQFWDQAILIDPHNVYFYTEKSQALIQSENLQAAEESWSSYQDGSNKSDNESEEIEQTSPITLSENVEKALKSWDEGISNNPNDIEFYNQKVKLLKRLGRKKDALACREFGLEINKNDPQFYIMLAEELQNQKYILESINSIDQGLKRSNDERLITTKWLQLSKQKMLRKAIMYFRLSGDWSYQGRKLKYIF